MTLDEALEKVSVHDANEVNPRPDLTDWYGVSTDMSGGIIAYFNSMEAALAYRLMLINMLLNPKGFEG